MSDVRYALYFAPELDSAWGRFGSRWLGRCAATGEARLQPAIDAMPAQSFRALTTEPRRYGFHATLKAPFRLAPGCTRDQLVVTLRQFCAEQRSFMLPPLVPRRLDDFVALVPQVRSAEIAALADACVERFDEFRAPLTDAERERRLRSTLSERQRLHVERWGYPYVMNDYRFHMTLTGSARELAPRQIEGLIAAYAQDMPVSPLCVDAMCLFEQGRVEQPFVISERIMFGEVSR